MQLTAFEVEHYRGIFNSGKVEVTPLTVLVGKNEAGKTSLLRALQKLNPFAADPYVMDSEWPRGRRQERNPKQVVCTAEFELSSEEIAQLKDLVGIELPVRKVEFSRNYAGTLSLKIPWTEETLPDIPPKSVLESLAKLLEEPPSSVGDAFRAKAHELVELARKAVLEDSSDGFSTLKDTQTKTLQGARSPGNPQRQAEDQFVENHSARIDEVAKSISKAKTPRGAVREMVMKWLPTFVYMSDYRSFTGSAQLDQVLERRNRKALTEEDRTLLMILKLSGLDLEKEVAKGNAQDREQRQYDMDDASATLTRTISDRWGQRRYEVQFRADGQQFYTFVKDEKDPALIKLEERSKGFQWFFSFDLMFMNESKGTFKNCIILLDEPGLNLHPSAQRDLLDRLEEYAQDNVLVYTTHLPFMIDLAHPERIRVLIESEQGTKVSSDLTSSQPEARFVLQAALGMDGSSSFLLSRRNLVVEGAEDFWIVTALSALLRRSGLPSLPPDVFITPAGGASVAASIATLMIGQKLEVVVLLDSDKAGYAARKQLVEKWITRYQKTHSTVLNLGPAAGADGREFAIEDLFPDDYYLGFVQKVHASQLAAAGLKEIKLLGEDQLCKRVERALAGAEIRFLKAEVAKLIMEAISCMKGADELPPHTKESAGRLFASITGSLGMIDSVTGTDKR